MTALHKNRVQMTVTGTPGTGTITLNAASSGYQTFAAAYAANATVDVMILDGTAWEVARNCTYTNSGTTLTRGTLEASSTGSAISLTSAAVVSVVMTAEKGNSVESQLARGIVIVRNDNTTTLSIAASTFTKLTPINSEEYDPNGWWDNSNQKFQPTRAGRYLIVAGSQITFASPAAQASYLLVLRKNGTDFAHMARAWVPAAATNLNAGVSGTALVDFNGSSDYVEPFGWHNDSVSRSTVAGTERQFFMAAYLSDT